MNKNRLISFSDNVISIIMTIMVLEMHLPHGAALSDLAPLVPTFISYVVSFIFIGIYWNNHHHMMHAVDKISGGVLWANLFLLFWLSLIPFITGWMGENNFAPVPVVLYGVVLLMAALAYYFLEKKLIRDPAENKTLAYATGSRHKEKLSLLLYVIALPLAFVHPYISLAIYLVVAGIWLVPDRRIERKLQSKS